MNTGNNLANLLSKYDGQRLDVSARGSGLNAVWKIVLNGKPAILKTYDSRRGPVKTFFTNCEHMLAGKTPYRASARCRTETNNLRCWRSEGFDVPEIIEHSFDLPVPCLCMEYVEGRTLLSILIDAQISGEEKDNIFSDFVKLWGERHASAQKSVDPGLVQEHATFEHVLVGPKRFVTFDLEVSYTGIRDTRALVAREICGYLRSLLKKLPEDTGNHFLKILLDNYPDRLILDYVYREFFNNPSSTKKLAYMIDRAHSRRPGRVTKFDAARRLNQALTDYD